MITAAHVEVLVRNLELTVKNERYRRALVKIAEFGGGDGGDWVACCEIARKALDHEG